MSFLHGVETKEIKVGAAPIQQVKAAVIGIVGTAPIYSVASANQKVNEPVLILGDVDGAQYFGEDKTGYTIRKAIDAIVAQKKTAMLVVNVFDPATHKTALSGSPVEKTFDANDEIAIGKEGITGLVVTDSAEETTYVLNTDYSLEPITGVITRIEGGAISAEATVKIQCNYADPSLVDADDIIGTTDVDGNRTGLQAFKDCYQMFGMFPKIIICPGYSDNAGVASGMKTISDAIRARALVDAAEGVTRNGAITNRGVITSNFYTSSPRVTLCYPKLKDEGGNLVNYSQYLAGVWAKTIIENGYWWSPSNKEINGITGVERRLSAMINDPTCDVNLLNEKGITTVFNVYGTGIRTWGNRSAAWPTNPDMENFMSIQLVKDVLHESVEYAMLDHIDPPLSNAVIDAVVESVNQFMRVLIGRGALIDGKCSYSPEKNPAVQLAAGQVVYDLEFCGPPPQERITFESFHNIQMLQALTGGVS